MSTVKEQMAERNKKKKSRRYGGTAPSVAKLSWSDVNSANLLELIDAALNVGGAIRLGKSRDGGALALGVYGDGDEPYTVYSPSIEGMEDHISHLGVVFEAIAAEQ